jgi:hypothetical protein
MPDKNSYSQYIDPQFARYDTELAGAMTEWLYADPKSNPLWNNPELWPTGPRVQMIQRNLTFTGLAAAAASTQTLNFTIAGGRNAIVFSRSASVARTAATVETLPNTLASYVTVEQRRVDGFLEIETAPINNCFGLVPGWPVTTPAPQFWEGNVQRRFTVTNNSAIQVNIDFSFMVAFLDTGR